MDLTKTNFNTLLLEITRYNHLIYYCFYIITKLQDMGVRPNWTRDVERVLACDAQSHPILQPCTQPGPKPILLNLGKCMQNETWPYVSLLMTLRSQHTSCFLFSTGRVLLRGWHRFIRYMWYVFSIHHRYERHRWGMMILSINN
jgi:hypothetical protein